MRGEHVPNPWTAPRFEPPQPVRHVLRHEGCWWLDGLGEGEAIEFVPVPRGIVVPPSEADWLRPPSVPLQLAAKEPAMAPACGMELIRKHGRITPREFSRLDPQSGNYDSARRDLEIFEWMGFGSLVKRADPDGSDVVFALHDEYKAPGSSPTFDDRIPPRMVTALLADADVVRKFKRAWRRASPEGRVVLMLDFFEGQGEVDQDVYEARWRAVRFQLNWAVSRRCSEPDSLPSDGDLMSDLNGLPKETQHMLLAVATHMGKGTLGPALAAALTAAVDNPA